MISSEDVRRVTFDRAMRGYRCEDVDDYLKQVADSMDALAAEQEELQKKILVLAQRIDQYRADEDTLRTTMLNAQRLGENVIKEAKQKAAEIIRAATIKAEDREQHARDEVELSRQELVTLKREADSFKKALMDMYRKHIELLTKMPSYVEEEPEPAPAPDPVPEQPAAVAAEPAPAEEAFEQQQFEAEPAAAEEEYYEEEEAAPAEEPADTLEFPLPESDETVYVGEHDLTGPEAPRGERFAPGAGLYDAAAEAPARPRKRTSRRRASDDLPDGLESFAGVDFDS